MLTLISAVQDTGEGASSPDGTATVDIITNLRQIPSGESLANTSFTQVIASAVNGAIIIGALLLLVYLILGAIAWITSGGDKGKVEAARNKIIQAGIGFVLLVAVWGIYIFALNVLGVDLGQASSGGGGGGGGGVCTVGQTGSDGGAGGYCSGGGAARMKCFGPGEGPTYQANYNHWEPCSCISGSELPQYDFSSC